MSSKLVKCAVPNCRNNFLLPSEVSKWFHFPDQNSLTSIDKDGKTCYYSTRRLWMNRVGLTRLGKNAVICPLHFTESDFTVTEDGQTILKEDVLPCLVTANDPQLEIEEKQDHKQNENIIETVEKSDDDDDDVEIIEPHRETITLDDDDEFTPQKEFNLSKSKEGGNMQDPISISQQKDSNIHLTCLSSEAITASVKDVVGEPPNTDKFETTYPSTSGTIILKKNGKVEKINLINDPITAKAMKDASENLNLRLHCVSKDGEKYFVHIPKPGLSNAVSLPAASVMKSAKVPDVKVQVKDSSGQNLAISDSMKRQISMAINRNQVRSSATEKINETLVLKSASPKKIFKMFKLPPAAPNLKKGVTPQNNFSTANRIGVQGTKISISSGKNLIKPQNGFLRQALTKSETSIPQKKNLLPSKVDKGQRTKEDQEKKQNNQTQKIGILGGSFKYVDIEEILSSEHIKKEAPEEEDTLKVTKEIGTQTDDRPQGFVDMYEYIRKNMIDFTFDAFGQTYTLKECGLHFAPSTTCKRWDKKIAIVSHSTLSSTDSLLLSAMNISIAFAKDTKSTESKGYTQEITNKRERISKTELWNKLYLKNDNTNILIENKREENQNFTVTEKDKKIILCPNLVKLTKNKEGVFTDMAKTSLSSKLAKGNSKINNKTSKTLAEESVMDRRKIIKKKKKNQLKSSLARSKKILQLPISQMNPTLRGRLNVDRNRFRKTKRPVKEGVKKKTRLEDDDSEVPIGDEIKTSTSAEKDPLWDNLGQGDFSEDRSPVKTRSTTRGKKRDYRRLSTNGTTEDVKRTPVKRVKPIRKFNAKKSKYSDKVGAIESFLEVVLEPESNELEEKVNETEKEVAEDILIIPEMLKLSENQSV